MTGQERFLQPLLLLAPKVFAAASEVQMVMGLYEVLSSAINGDRTQVYKVILDIIRTKLSPTQCSQIMTCMKTAVTALEFANSIREILNQILEYSNKSIDFSESCEPEFLSLEEAMVKYQSVELTKIIRIANSRE